MSNMRLGGFGDHAHVPAMQRQLLQGEPQGRWHASRDTVLGCSPRAMGRPAEAQAGSERLAGVSAYVPPGRARQQTNRAPHPKPQKGKGRDCPKPRIAGHANGGRPPRFTEGWTHGCITVVVRAKWPGHFTLKCTTCASVFRRSRQSVTVLAKSKPPSHCSACKPSGAVQKYDYKKPRVYRAERVPPNPGHKPTRRCKRCEGQSWRRTDFAGKPLQECPGCGLQYADHQPLRSCGTASSALGGVCAVVW